MTTKWILIGLSGVTCGGKTTVARTLHQKLLQSVIFNQDDFFLDKTSDKLEIIPELNHANWEIFSSIDYDSFFEKIIEKTKEPVDPTLGPAVIIIEGHILFNYKPLAEILDRKYFFTLTKEQCYDRRKVRTYDPPDPPGYFDICVWPMYLRNREEMEANNSDIVYVDGSQLQANIIQFVIKDLESNLGLVIA